MDWNSEEGRALLRAAYPDGYLAMRGVLTVGGWEYGLGGFKPSQQGPVPTRCDVGAQGLQLHNVRAPAFRHIVDGGDLLPNPDPTDHATWACLLHDFAAAAGGVLSYSTQIGLLWYSLPTEGGTVWALATIEYDGPEPTHQVIDYYGPFLTATGTNDPAEALVRARASLNGDKK